MSAKANYRLLGEHFLREFKLNEDGVVPNSLFLSRLPRQYHEWYIKSTFTDNGSASLAKVSDIDNKRYQEAVVLLSEKFQQPCAIVVLDYDKQIIVTKKDLKTKKINREKFLSSRSWKNIANSYQLSKDRFLDAMVVRPILPEPEFKNPNDEILRAISPKVNIDEKIIVFTGEMIWSGWCSLGGVLDIQGKRKNNKLLIMDSFGYLQEKIQDKNPQILINELNLLTKGVLCMKKFDKNNVNIAQHFSEWLHTNVDISFTCGEGKYFPDFLCVDKKRKLSGGDFIKVGMNVNKIISLPSVMFGKKEVNLQYPADSLLQKNEDDEVKLNEDIGRYPLYEEKLVKVKFPKQLEFRVKHNELLLKGSLVAQRRLIKGLVNEKITTPMKSRIDLTYKDFGILKFLSVVGDKVFRSKFSGKIQKINRLKNTLEINILGDVMVVPYSYSIGKDFQGRMYRPIDIRKSSEPKILLLKENEINLLTKDYIVRNSLVGLILPSCSYSHLEKLNKSLPGLSEMITIVVVEGFDLSERSDIIDIFYMMEKPFVVKNSSTLSFLIDKESSRQFYLRLRSKGKSSSNRTLKKGEGVSYFNYFVSEPYARIEKSAENRALLMVSSGMLEAGIENIIKFKPAEIEDK